MVALVGLFAVAFECLFLLISAFLHVGLVGFDDIVVCCCCILGGWSCAYAV